MSITIIGDAFIDVTVPAYDMNPGETHHRKLVQSCGGLANVALIISKLGEKVQFMGKVGDDIFGEFFKQHLKKGGVEDFTFVDHNNLTGLCISMVSADGERVMVADRRANDYLHCEEVEKFLDKITSSEIVYFSGYSFVSPSTMKVILYITNACHGKCKIWFNPGAPNIIHGLFKEYIAEFVDVLIGNLDEARIITREYHTENIAQTLRKIVDLSVITLGKEGCMISAEGEHLIISPQKSENAIDTTGAGDAFAAGFIVGKVRGLNLVECAQLANETASNFITERALAFR